MIYSQNIVFLLVNLIQNTHQAYHQPKQCQQSSPYRTYDGSCNNVDHPDWGAVSQCLRRVLPPDYGRDPTGQNSIRRAKSGAELPNARYLSNKYCDDNKKDDRLFTQLLMQLGQFITEDITHAAELRRNPNHTQFDVFLYRSPCCTHSNPSRRQCDPIPVPKNDPKYSPFNITCINKFRALECKHNTNGIREQRNARTSYLDMSNTYSINEEDNKKSRLMRRGLMKSSRDVNGRCKLLMRQHGDVEYNPEETGESCEESYDQVCFLAGASPSNIQPLLTLLHTVLMRQHNRLATELFKVNRHWSDEKLFQEARRILLAQYQVIIYKEYLPLIIGHKRMTRHRLYLANPGQWTDYDSLVNAGLTNEFSTAAYRYGHSTAQGKMMHVEADGKVSYSRMKDQFFHPKVLYDGHLPAMLRGIIRQPQAAFDPSFVDDLRHHLQQPFDKPMGQDLAAINTQRGRDHGLRGYVEYLNLCENVNVKQFEDLDKYMDKKRWRQLKKLYKHVNDIDLFLGGLSEKPVKDSVVGPTFACLIGQQFEVLKYGDRFYLEHRNQAGSFSIEQLNALRKTRLATFVCRNEKSVDEVQENVLKLESADNPLKKCKQLYDLVQDIHLWKDKKL